MIKKEDIILFIGLGGAGQRHLRIFRSLLPDNNFIAIRKKKTTPLLNPDFSIDVTCNIEEKYNIKSISEEELLKKYSPKLTIISTPTAFHSDYAILAKSINSNVFVEKPGISSLADLKNIKKEFYNSKISFKVGFQRMYHPLVKQLISLIKEEKGKFFNCKVKVSSYVPDWHPYEDFKNLYACRRELGGGVALTECHELELLNHLFGEPKEMEKIFKKDINFGLNVSDNMLIKSKYKNCAAEIDISFLRKPLERKIELRTEDKIYTLDLHNEELTVFSKKIRKEFCQKVPNHKLFLDQAKEVIKLKNDNKYQIDSLQYLSKYLEDS